MLYNKESEKFVHDIPFVTEYNWIVSKLSIIEHADIIEAVHCKLDVSTSFDDKFFLDADLELHPFLPVLQVCKTKTKTASILNLICWAAVQFHHDKWMYELTTTGWYYTKMGEQQHV